MFGLGKHGPDGKYAALVDIGSGSVAVAIAVSDPHEDKPTIIFSERQHAPQRKMSSAEQLNKNIISTLVNAMLSLGSKGTQALREYDPKATLDEVLITIAAPWAYTTTKSISYTKDEPFDVTKKLVAELIRSAQTEAMETIDEQEVIKQLGLEVIARSTINITVNGYQITKLHQQSAKSVVLSHAVAMTNKKLFNSIVESSEKILPKATLQHTSFMLLYYFVLDTLATNTKEACLVDITAHATEIGIVRDGVLTYTTHAPVGTHTLAEEISLICNIPFAEALGYIRGNTALLQVISAKQKADIDAVVKNHTETIAETFTKTGDILAIPQTMFLHTDDRTEAFFESILTAASTSDHHIHLLTSKLIGETAPADSAILLSAHFFHKKLWSNEFSLD